jgi:hypothetical protein
VTGAEFETVVSEMHTLASDIASAKRPDYTQESSDVLQNFKDGAKDAGIRPMQDWMVHFQKQYSAICRMVKNPAGTPSEPIIARFADLRNYLDLGYALYVEESTSRQ